MVLCWVLWTVGGVLVLRVVSWVVCVLVLSAGLCVTVMCVSARLVRVLLVVKKVWVRLVLSYRCCNVWTWLRCLCRLVTVLRCVLLIVVRQLMQ